MNLEEDGEEAGLCTQGVHLQTQEWAGERVSASQNQQILHLTL